MQPEIQTRIKQKNRNDMNIPFFEPRAITFLTTFRCTAACENCCFQCTPKIKKRMTLEEMKRYLDKCLEAYPSIKMLVFSGGECTLLKDDLTTMITYASSKGLHTRIVTNGWWAKSYKIAYEKIKAFKEAGLNEINFSTGDDHQEWVPFKYVRNAAVATVRHNLLCAINVETKDNSSFDIDKIMEKDKVFLDMASSNNEHCCKPRIHIERGIWAPIKKSCENKITYKDYEDSINFKRCEHLYSIIPINPYGEVMACCGITCEQNPYLRLGNINREDIKTIYERAFDDVLKLWLFTEGPASMAAYINTKNGVEKPQIEPTHACVLCREIFRNPQNIELLRNNSKEFSSRIILKYCMLNPKSKTV